MRSIGTVGLRRIVRAVARRVQARAAAIDAMRADLRLRAGRQWRRLNLAKYRASQVPVTLFVATEAGLLPHFAAHAILARALRDAGHAAFVLSCDGLLPICSVKFAMGLGPTAPNDETNMACVACRKSALSVGQSYGLPDRTIDSVLDADMRAEIDAILAGNAQALWKTQYDGVDFGGACLGETLRSVRKSRVAEFTADDHALLKAVLNAALDIYFAVRALTQKFNIQRIAYYGDYAYHLPLVVLGNRLGIAMTHISHAYSGDIDQRFVSIRPGFVFAHVFDLLGRWNGYRNRAIYPKDVERLREGALFRLVGHGGVSTFSPNWIFTPGDFRKEIGLNPKKKTVVAFLSSLDEIECGHRFMDMVGVKFEDERDPFEHQDHWVKELVAWAGTRSDLQLLLRLHPRMASGARFSTTASDVDRLQRSLANLPANVFVEWPDSKISSYNLAEVADVVLTAWSSMAIELSQFGIPVVSAFPRIGLVPTGDFVMTGHSSKAYFEIIGQLLHRPSSFDAITGAIRWAHLLYWSHLVDLTDVVPTRNYNQVPPYRTPRNKQAIIDVLAGHQDIVALNMSRYDEGAVSAFVERAATVRTIEIIVGLLASGQRLKPGQGLRIESDSGGLIYQSLAGDAGALDVTLSRDGIVTSSADSRSPGRYSKIAQRLASVLESTRRESEQRSMSMPESH
jgi:hypothetical protein